MVAAGVAVACDGASNSGARNSTAPDGGGAAGGGVSTGVAGSGIAVAGTAGIGNGGHATASGGAGGSHSGGGSGGSGGASNPRGTDSTDAGSTPDANTGDGSTSTGPVIPKPPPPGSFLTHPSKPSTGEVTLNTEADMNAFCSQYDGVVGSLTISSPTLTTLDALQCLVEVTGAFEIDASALTSAALPKLKAVGSLDLGDAKALATVDLPQLAFDSVGDLRIYGSDALLTLALPNLAYVAQNLAITANTKLTDLSVPNLAYAGSDVSSDNSQLVHADFSGLVTVGHDFTIRSTALAALALHELRSVGHTVAFFASYADVDLSHLVSVGELLQLMGNGKDDDDLTLLDLASLESASVVTIEEHPQLEEIRAPKLNSATGIFVALDPVLEKVAFPALVSAGLTFGNDPKLTIADFSSLATGMALDLRSGGPADISLPSLTTAQSIQTSGAHSFVAPLLTSLDSGTFNGATDGFRLGLPLVTRVPQLSLGTGLNDLTLPKLESVDTLMVSDVALSTLEFPNLDHSTSISIGPSPTLTSVHVPLVSQLDTLWISGPVLQSVAFDTLASVNKLTLEDAAALQTLSFPLLTQIVTSLDTNNTGLGDLSLSTITFLGSLDVASNPNLKSLSIPAADILEFYVSDNAALTTIDVHSMKTAYPFSMSNNGKLTALSGFGGLTKVSDFQVLNHASLVDLTGLHGIQSVSGKFHITGNTVLPESEITALVAAIGRQNIAGDYVVQ